MSLHNPSSILRRHHDGMPPKSRPVPSTTDSRTKKGKSLSKSIGDGIERGVATLGRVFSGKSAKDDDGEKRTKGSRDVLSSPAKEVPPKTNSRKAVRTSSGAATKKKSNVLEEVPKPVMPRRIPRVRRVENARRVAQRRMIVEGLNDIGKGYTEQDVRNVLASTRMYDVFPHMLEGETRAEAEPLEDDEGFLIDGMVMPDDSLERETERAARRQAPPQADIGNPTEPEYYDVQGEDTSSEEEDAAWLTSGLGVAGPSNKSKASLFTRDDSSMKSAFSEDSARASWHATATEAIPVAGPSKTPNARGVRFGKANK
ncbi:hypothetical protein BDZ89DRAFT_1168233 [Hymenopellis radicata]|nr:hypothetical protein BDZ89DRAFT_1168233 [Hymenopellis radicata]